MKTMNRIEQVNGFPLEENWYESMEIVSAEDDIAALHESWGSAERYRGEECGRCRGRGYARKDGNVGCVVCGGRGVVDAGADDA